LSLYKIRNVYYVSGQAVEWEATFSDRYLEPKLCGNRLLVVEIGDF